MAANATRTLDADYLVVGCGAAGTAFTDALVAECGARVVMVDRRHAPGGHWNDAYPFVRLHMSSGLYGVNSLPLGSDTIEQHGLNQGLYERASGPEICAYYDRVMREVLLASGRVRYFPMCDYTGAGWFVSRVSGEKYQVRVRQRVVDATYLEVSVPGSTSPPFDIEPGVRCVPVGELPRESEPADGYVIIGAGKTAMDACLWLLDLGVPPDAIRWIRPRESWLFNRTLLQGGELVGNSFAGLAELAETAAEASSADDYFDRAAGAGWVFRVDVDDELRPTMFKGATATVAELEQLRRISNVVRLGHVRRLERDCIVLENGKIPTTPGHLHVHCAAAGLNLAPAVPVFAGDRIVLQPVRFGAACFSAALAGFVEASRHETAEKNRLCPPNPNPDVPRDFLRGLLVQGQAEAAWSQQPDLLHWVERSRLNLLRGLADHMDKPEVQRAHERFFGSRDAAALNLPRLAGQAAA